MNAAITSPNFEFIIPNNETATLYCARKLMPQAQAPAVKLFPEGEITVFTSEGNISIAVPQEPQGNSGWANEIAQKITHLEQDNKKLHDETSAFRNNINQNLPKLSHFTAGSSFNQHINKSTGGQDPPVLPQNRGAQKCQNDGEFVTGVTYYFEDNHFKFTFVCSKIQVPTIQ